MKVCIICQQDVAAKSAAPIKEDRIIRTIRAVKKAFGIAQNNELFVCSDCTSKHAERRKSFEKSMLFASVLAGLVLVVLLAAVVLSGRFDPWGFVSAFVVALFILALPVFKYTPAAEALPARATPSPAIVPPPLTPQPQPAPEPAPTPPEQKAKKRSRSKK